METQHEYFTTKTPLFTLSNRFRKNYLVPLDLFETEFNPSDNIALPLVVDSEYYAPSTTDFHNDDFSFRKPVTIQVKHIHHDDSFIFDHNDFIVDSLEKGLTPRHLPTKHNFILGDYLEQYGHTVSFYRMEDRDEREAYKNLPEKEKRPRLVVIMYAHFALADIGMTCPDADYQNDISHKIAYKQITMTRRLSCGRSGQCNMPWFITIDGFEYQVALKIIDTCAIHGVAGYKEFCGNSGIELDSKDLMGDDIKRMNEVYYERPEDFDEYSLGDLKVYDALKANAENMKIIWNDLEIGEYYQEPRLSIGSTVTKLFESKLYKLFDLTPEVVFERGFDRKAFFQPITHYSSPAHLASLVNSNAFSLVKCDGGRCKNNKPIFTGAKIDGVDTDLAGAYSGVMSVLEFPLGIPVIYATKYDQKKNKGVSLKSVLRAFGSEMLDGLWYMRIDTKDLAYEQDLIGSWMDFKRHLERPLDTDITEGAVDITSGFTKIFTREIHHGCLTSDLFDVINQWNPRQRDDFIEKTTVLALAFYPKNLRVELEEFKAGTIHKRFSTRAKDLRGFELITQDNHVWTSIRMGEFFTDIFKAKRQMHPKKTPLNSLFKLMGNTAYGCAVSRFFETSNMIFANQITAKCRAMMYMTEKALNLYGSITDGQVFDINRVLHRADRPLKTEWLARLYSISKTELNHCRGGRFAPLPFTDRTPAAINQATLEHVRRVWPDSKLLNGIHRRLDPNNDGTLTYTDKIGVFEFEMKEFTPLLVMQGSSNYSFDPEDSTKTKFRSYESKREHQAVELDSEGNLVKLDIYEKMNPAQHILNEIYCNPHAVKRLPPFIKTAILKATAYAANYRNKWKNSIFQVGDNVLKTGCPKYFSISQFTYQTAKQFDSWKKTHEKLKRKHGESFELFFTNPDGTLDYQKMIIKVDEMIRQGVTDPLKIFDPHNHLHRTPPHYIIQNIQQTVDVLKNKVSTSMFFDDFEDENDFPLIDTSEGWE